MGLALNHLIRGGANNWGGGGGWGGVVGFIKVRIGVTPCFFHVYASTTKFNVIDFIRRHLKYIINVKIQEFY